MQEGSNKAKAEFAKAVADIDDDVALTKMVRDLKSQAVTAYNDAAKKTNAAARGQSSEIDARIAQLTANYEKSLAKVFDKYAKSKGALNKKLEVAIKKFETDKSVEMVVSLEKLHEQIEELDAERSAEIAEMQKEQDKAAARLQESIKLVSIMQSTKLGKLLQSQIAASSTARDKELAAEFKTQRATRDAEIRAQQALFSKLPDSEELHRTLSEMAKASSKNQFKKFKELQDSLDHSIAELGEGVTDGILDLAKQNARASGGYKLIQERIGSMLRQKFLELPGVKQIHSAGKGVGKVFGGLKDAARFTADAVREHQLANAERAGVRSSKAIAGGALRTQALKSVASVDDRTLLASIADAAGAPKEEIKPGPAAPIKVEGSKLPAKRARDAKGRFLPAGAPQVLKIKPDNENKLGVGTRQMVGKPERKITQKAASAKLNDMSTAYMRRQEITALQKISDYLSKRKSGGKSMMTTLLGAALTMLTSSKAFTWLRGLASSGLGTLVKGIGTLVGKIPGIGKMLSFLGRFTPAGIAMTLAGALGYKVVGPWVKRTIDGWVESITGTPGMTLGSWFYDFVNESIPRVWNQAKTWLGDQWEGFTKYLDRVIAPISGSIKSITTAVSDAFIDAKNFIAENMYEPLRRLAAKFSIALPTIAHTDNSTERGIKEEAAKKKAYEEQQAIAMSGYVGRGSAPRGATVVPPTGALPETMSASTAGPSDAASPSSSAPAAPSTMPAQAAPSMPQEGGMSAEPAAAPVKAMQAAPVKQPAAPMPPMKAQGVTATATAPAGGNLESLITKGSNAKTDGLVPAAKQGLTGMAMEYAQAHNGKKLHLESGHRTTEDQIRISAENKAKGINNAAKPGTSKHEQGAAIDLNKKQALELRSSGLAEKYGFGWLPNTPNEEQHLFVKGAQPAEIDRSSLMPPKAPASSASSNSGGGGTNLVTSSGDQVQSGGSGGTGESGRTTTPGRVATASSSPSTGRGTVSVSDLPAIAGMDGGMLVLNLGML